MEATNLSGSLVLRGVLLILFGAAAVFWPGLTLLTLVYLFSALVLINGVFDLVFGVTRLSDAADMAMNRVLLVVFGAIQIGVGIYLLRHPGVGLRAFLLLLGFTLIVRGLFEAIEGLFEEKGDMYRSIMVVGGVLAALAGILLLFQPLSGGIAFVWILGVYALITGPLFIALALDLTRMARLEAPRRARV